VFVSVASSQLMQRLQLMIADGGRDASVCVGCQFTVDAEAAANDSSRRS